MESPTLSRPPSSIFSPGAHRRSHPNLQHLSLAPLTPKYPIDPSDFDAYFDPDTRNLHTSSSLSNIALLPGPRGILTNSPARSRANSKTRLKRKTKSTVSIRAPEDLPHGALTAEGFGVKGVKKASLRLQPDSSWLVQTGLALTEGSRESKGQLWIVKRDSSTSLLTPEQEPRSGKTTPNRSRKSSRTRKRDLSMTPGTQLKRVSTESEYRPDWADSQTQAEIAAELDRNMADELDADSDDEWFRDRYGMIDFEGQFDSEDEDDVREAVRHGFRLGRWMDGIVDVFLKMEDDDEPDLEVGEQPAQVTPVEKVTSVGSNASDVSDDSTEAPPERPQRLWDDVTWFGRLVVRNFTS